MIKDSVLTYDRLKELVIYKPTLGQFIARIGFGRRKPGDHLLITKQGYKKISLDGDLYQASHLAVLYMTGKWPKGWVRYIDQDRSNLKWSNLLAGSRTGSRAGSRTSVETTDPGWSWILRY